METVTCDVLVIGAGPAGTLAAAILKDKGWDVRIVEKQKFPRFVIGESLLPRCMDHLREAGLLDVIDAQNFQKKIGARFVKNGAICDFNFSEQYTDGSTWTWQVPRDEFDTVLAQAVADKGVAVDFECGVENIEFFEGRQLTKVRHCHGGEQTIESRFVIDGSGYGRVIPRLLKLDKPSAFPPRAAVFAHVKFDSYDENSRRIDIVTVTDRMWAWVIPFSDGRASVGFVGELDCFTGMGSTHQEKFMSCIEMNSYVKNKLGSLHYTMEPKEISAYSVAVEKFYGDGFVLTGNSTEFLDPVFSSGVTFAMESGVTAAKLVHQQLQGLPVDWERDYVTHIQRGVDTFRSYVKGWYDGSLPSIFFAETTLQDFKEQICSVLAGYVWDETNPFVKKHDRILTTLSKVVSIIDDDK
jgi:flavin-dependent dehydrogenase